MDCQTRQTYYAVLSISCAINNSTNSSDFKNEHTIILYFRFYLYNLIIIDNISIIAITVF